MDKLRLVFFRKCDVAARHSLVGDLAVLDSFAFFVLKILKNIVFNSGWFIKSMWNAKNKFKIFCNHFQPLSRKTFPTIESEGDGSNRK